MHLTEKMIDAPRQFLLGLELRHWHLEDMRKFLTYVNCDFSCWPEWAKTETGHITKAGKAILIYTMMENAKELSCHVKNQSQADAANSENS